MKKAVIRSIVCSLLTILLYWGAILGVVGIVDRCPLDIQLLFSDHLEVFWIVLGVIHFVAYYCLCKNCHIAEIILCFSCVIGWEIGVLIVGVRIFPSEDALGIAVVGSHIFLSVVLVGVLCLICRIIKMVRVKIKNKRCL
ncbi:MAG: hypothetical protein PHX08_09160 [Lachnospiraceae bacterium]|nr:hypothetical protein [Lachnospiraceae bacterium]